MVEPAIPVHLSKMLCEVEVVNNKVIRFNTEDNLPVISKDEFLKQKKENKVPNRVCFYLIHVLVKQCQLCSINF